MIGISSVNMRRRVILIALGSILLIGVVVAAWVLFADKERIEAERERRIALARELISTAEVLMPADPELALLLAREAERTWHSERSEVTLRRVLLNFLNPSGLPEALSEMRGPQEEPRHVTFSPDGKWVIATYASGTWVWETGTELLLARLSGHPADLASAVISPDGNWIATLGLDGSVWVWNTGTWKRAATLPANLGSQKGILQITAAAFNREGTHLALVGADQKLRIWEIRTLEGVSASEEEESVEIRETLGSFSGNIRSLEYDHDGNRILIVGDNSLDVLNSAGDKKLVTIGTDHIWRALWTRDGRGIVAATLSGLHSWDAEKGEPLAEPKGSFTLGDALSVDLSRDGRWIVTLSASDRVSVINAQTGTELVGIAVDGENVRKVALGPNGRDITIAGGTLVRVYTCEVCVSMRELMMLAESSLSRELTCEERNEYLHEGEVCPTPTVP
jgi:WD40 repeat protein